MARWRQPPCDETDGIHAAPGRAGAQTEIAFDPFMGCCTECEAAQVGCAGSGAGVDGATRPAGSAKGRMRWAQLLKRVFDIDIEQCPHPHPSGTGCAAATACAGGAAGSVSGGVRCESGLDFERAGGGARTALGQSLRWRGIRVR